MRAGIEYSAWLTILFEGLQDIVGIFHYICISNPLNRFNFQSISTSSLPLATIFHFIRKFFHTWFNFFVHFDVFISDNCIQNYEYGILILSSLVQI